MSGCVSCPDRSRCDYYIDTMGLGCIYEDKGGLVFSGYKDQVEETWFGLSHRHIRIKTYRLRNSNP